MGDKKSKPKKIPSQSQSQPGEEHKMKPQPEIIRSNYKGSNKLKGKVAFITGGDSGIGRSVAVHFAREGASVAIVYLEENADAQETKRMVEEEGGSCLILEGDLKDAAFCKKSIASCIKKFKKLNILVNNAAVQFPKDRLEQISEKQLEKTFRTNIFAYFYIAKAAVVNCFQNCILVDYSQVISGDAPVLSRCELLSELYFS